MSCEIVKAWVGNMDNTYFYCRDHKVECKTEKDCDYLVFKSEPEVICGGELRHTHLITLKVPSPGTFTRSIDDYNVGQFMTCISNPGLGLFFTGVAYIITFVNRSNNTIGISDEHNTTVAFYIPTLSPWFDFGDTRRRGLAAWLPSSAQQNIPVVQTTPIKSHVWEITTDTCIYCKITGSLFRATNQGCIP